MEKNEAFEADMRRFADETSAKRGLHNEAEAFN